MGLRAFRFGEVAKSECARVNLGLVFGRSDGQ